MSGESWKNMSSNDQSILLFHCKYHYSYNEYRSIVCLILLIIDWNWPVIWSSLYTFIKMEHYERQNKLKAKSWTKFPLACLVFRVHPSFQNPRNLSIYTGPGLLQALWLCHHHHWVVKAYNHENKNIYYFQQFCNDY